MFAERGVWCEHGVHELDPCAYCDRPMGDTCRRCSEPAAVQLPRGGWLCSWCASTKLAELTELADTLGCATKNWDTALERWKARGIAAEKERDEARDEVERLRRDLDACKAVLGFFGGLTLDPEPGE